MSNSPIPRRNNLYGFPNPNTALFPEPIRSASSPNIYDFQEIGTEWVNTTTGGLYFLTSITNGQANWVLITTSGGAGVFSSLLVNPGPVTTQGTGAVNISADAVATTVNVGTGAGVKTVAIGSSTGASSTSISSGSGNLTIASNAGTLTLSTINRPLEIISGTGALSLSDDAVATTVNVASGAAAKTLNLGSSTTTSTTNVIAGTGGILLGAAGVVKVTPATATVASPTATATANVNVISITFTGFTTAASATQAYTIVSSKILVTSGIFVSVTCATTGAALTVTGVQQLAGSIVVNTTNNGGSSVSGNVIVNVWVIS